MYGEVDGYKLTWFLTGRLFGGSYSYRLKGLFHPEVTILMVNDTTYVYLFTEMNRKLIKAVG